MKVNILVVKPERPSRSWWLDPAFQQGGSVPSEVQERQKRQPVPQGVEHSRTVGSYYGRT